MCSFIFQYLGIFQISFLLFVSSLISKSFKLVDIYSMAQNRVYFLLNVQYALSKNTHSPVAG